MAEIDNISGDQSSKFLICPNCGAAGLIKPGGTVSVGDDGKITVPATCQSCNHEWLTEIEPSTTDPSAIQQRAMEPSILAPEIMVSDLEKDSPKKTRIVMIPLPIFWGIIILLIVLFGVGGWLFGELQREKTADATSEAMQAAQILVRATGTAEARRTATQQAADFMATGTAEARQVAAVTATVVQAATDVAATSTAEFRATSTAERVATIQAHSTAVAERQVTETAERVATAQTQSTAVVERQATQTAERVATLNAIATGTTEWRATATAEFRATPEPPELNVAILGCDTGLDVTRGLGEVKNAWVTVQNFGKANAHNVKIVLSANDEEFVHPDKEKTANVIPPDHQYSDKLTVDSGFGFGSSITVTVTSDETEPISLTRGQCRLLDENAKRLIASTLSIFW